MVNAAKHVIRKCGGFKQVSEWLDLDLSAVYRFTHERSKGGTDGVIPSRHQAVLLQKSRECGIDLKPDDFFFDGPDEPDAPPIEQEAAPTEPAGAAG